METTSTRTPWHLWVVGIIGLLWNAGGAFDYVMTQTRNADYMQNFTEAQLEYFYSFPAWADATWAIAVWGGVLGCVLLLLRSRWSVYVFAASFVCMLINMIYMYAINNGLEIMGGPGVAVFSFMIFAAALFLLLYARAMAKRGVLKIGRRR